MKLNSASVRIVRVYSEEIEERDFPVSLLPKPSSEIKPQVTCTVMKEVALHHLIRGKENAESKVLAFVTVLIFLDYSFDGTEYFFFHLHLYLSDIVLHITYVLIHTL